MINTALEKRVRKLNNKKAKNGDFVIYWMQSSHRVENNWALTYAVYLANKTDLPLAVYFGLSKDFPEANFRHYWFMLEGLREVSAELKKRKINFLIRIDSPVKKLIDLSNGAAAIVVDKGYLKVNSRWYKVAAEKCEAPLIQVEDNIIVPVEESSNKEEYSAATLRPKILAKLNYFLEMPSEIIPNKSSLNLELDTIEIDNADNIFSSFKIDNKVDKSGYFMGGSSKAKIAFEVFFKNSLVEYEKTGSNPENGLCSNLSPYLHFGQISPISVMSTF